MGRVLIARVAYGLFMVLPWACRRHTDGPLKALFAGYWPPPLPPAPER